MWLLFKELSKIIRKITFSPALGIERANLVRSTAPLQSPTDVALEMSGSAELCRERPNESSRTKYYDSSHADEQDARHPEEPATGLKKMED